MEGEIHVFGLCTARSPSAVSLPLHGTTDGDAEQASLFFIALHAVESQKCSLAVSFIYLKVCGTLSVPHWALPGSEPVKHMCTQKAD